jgi:hypothetical protein
MMNEIGKGFIDTSVIDIDFKKLKVDRDLARKHAYKIQGSVRMANGLFYTSEEWADKRKLILEKGLP